MAQIDKTTQFTQDLAITNQDGGTTNYATLNGSVDSSGLPFVSFYIHGGAIYREHLSEFKEAWSEFQETVFSEADKVSKATEE